MNKIEQLSDEDKSWPEMDRLDYRAKCAHRRLGKSIEEKGEDTDGNEIWWNIPGSPYKSINAAKRASSEMQEPNRPQTCKGSPSGPKRVVWLYAEG